MPGAGRRVLDNIIFDALGLTQGEGQPGGGAVAQGAESGVSALIQAVTSRRLGAVEHAL